MSKIVKEYEGIAIYMWCISSHLDQGTQRLLSALVLRTRRASGSGSHYIKDGTVQSTQSGACDSTQWPADHSLVCSEVVGLASEATDVPICIMSACIEGMK